MFRAGAENQSAVSDQLAWKDQLEVAERPIKRLELDENIFQNLERVTISLPVNERQSYQVSLQTIRKYTFHDLEREFNLLLPNPDHSRQEILDQGHQGLQP